MLERFYVWAETASEALARAKERFPSEYIREFEPPIWYRLSSLDVLASLRKGTWEVRAKWVPVDACPYEPNSHVAYNEGVASLGWRKVTRGEREVTHYEPLSVWWKPWTWWDEAVTHEFHPVYDYVETYSVVKK